MTQPNTGIAHIKVTADSVDPIYNDPYIEANELRSHPAPHRYMRGGFKGTDARFSFYFPEASRYQGRFFHNTYVIQPTSDIAPLPNGFQLGVGNLGFTLDSGAYYVQTNLGGRDYKIGESDPAIATYRVNAAAAKYSRVVAAELYGAHRPYGYLHGGSGGAFQTIGSAENTVGVWDGYVPVMMGTTHTVPSYFTIRLHALRVLKRRNKLATVRDALSPGGNGDPYAGLDDEERAALREATSFGYPLQAWTIPEALTHEFFAGVAPLVPMLDPNYNDDFWNTPGYLGADPTASIHAERFHFDTTVTEVIAGPSPRLKLASFPARPFPYAHLVILGGEHAGKSLPIGDSNGQSLGFAAFTEQRILNSIVSGDRVRIDNSWSLALQTYHRHQVPDTADGLYAWDQYRDKEGQPIYPQRRVLIGPMLTEMFSATSLNGNINGKVLMLQALLDQPWQADWYRRRVQRQWGDDCNDRFALWYLEHAQHDNPHVPAGQAVSINVDGAVQQALRDISAWVEHGIAPSETRYTVADSQIVVPNTATTRGGVQPVVELKANGSARTEVHAGESVTFTATIEAPPGTGPIVAAEWDFKGVGDYPVRTSIAHPQPLVSLSVQHTYDKPGTYFAVLRGTSQRRGDAHTPYARVQNIARVRVIVT